MATASGRRKRSGEFELIALLARELAGTRSRAVALGIGDDAAVLRVGKERVVVSVDDQVQGVHFDLGWLSLADVGYRSLQAAASDLAAMGATPLGAVASLHVPRGFPEAKLRELARGQAQAARQLGCPLVGGNVTRGQVLSVTTTVLGRVQTPLLRSGARAGDELWVLGDLGLARAVIDVSDGLAGDVQHLADESRVKAVVEASRLLQLVSPELCDLGDLLGEPGVALALTGGEDYALLCAGPRARRPARAKVVGRIERGRGSELELETGQRLALGPGFDHLRR